MDTKTNVEILREGYRLWNDSKAESVDYWLGLLAEDVQWCSIGDGAPGLEFSKTRSSKAEVVEYLQELGSEWNLIHYSVEEFVAEGDRVVVLGNCGWCNKRTGRTVESPKADFFRLKDGKIVEFFEFFDTAKSIAATQ